MSVDDQVRPLHLRVPESELDDLRERLRRTRLPEAETVAGPDGRLDWSQGPPLAYVADLVRYWSEEYDWRRVESELNDHGQALTEIDGLDVHFLHVRSPRPDARPMIITHGWPSSVVEPLAVIDELTDPQSPEAPAFHVVAPSLPGLRVRRDAGTKPAGTSNEPPTPGSQLMQRLGYDRFFAVGGDWGGRVTAALGSRHPDRTAGLHTFTPYVSEPADGPGDAHSGRSTAGSPTRVTSGGSVGGYSLQQSTRPQTVAYALVDSPVALLTWIVDKFHSWTDHRETPEPAVARDRILDTVTLYWLTATGGSSARFYWENFPPRGNREVVTVPAAVTIFPADIEKLPRRWVAQRFQNLTYWNVAERGGHFPMIEVPSSFVLELQQSSGPDVPVSDAPTRAQALGDIASSRTVRDCASLRDLLVTLAPCPQFAPSPA